MKSVMRRKLSISVIGVLLLVIMFLPMNISGFSFGDAKDVICFAMVLVLAFAVGGISFYEIIICDSDVKKGVELERQRDDTSCNENSKTESLSYVKSTLLASISQKIRTPMNTIAGFLHLVQKTDLDPKQRQFIERIDASSKSLLGIISDIVDFSRIEAGEFELENTSLNVSEIVHDVCDDFYRLARSKGINIYVDIATDLPLRVEGDPRRLSQILTNLIGNAVKFTDEGVVTVKVDGDSDGRFNFRVKDTGGGISDDHISAFFESFNQSGGSSSSKNDGTGLALAITKRLVELMGGEISVESEVGKGSEFCFSIKMKALKDQIDLSSSNLVTSEIPDFKDVNILLVEDNKLNQEVALGLLEETGAQVVVAENGQEAVDMVANRTFDIVLMDIMMPVMGGIEATINIRDTELEGEHLPIVAMSSNVMEADQAKAIAIGLDGYITKPVVPHTLYSEILNHLN